MLPSDELQIRIIKELASPSSFRWNVRESYASMAERIGVDEETVRRGVKRARESGFLKGWSLMLNPHLVGHESVAVQLEVDDEEKKPNAISQIMPLEGVVAVIDFHGKGLRVGLNYESEQDLTRKIQELAAICGRREVAVWKGSFPPSNLRMSYTDWQIVKALQKDPRRKPSEVAEEVRVSTRTVKRRLTRMTEGMAFFLLPMVNFDRQFGLNCDFLIFCPDEKKKNSLQRLVRTQFERVTIFSIEAEGVYMFAAVFANMGVAEEAHRLLKAVDGVESLRMDITREITIVNGWLDGQVEKHLSPPKAVDS